jgi:hypothetical protein
MTKPTLEQLRATLDDLKQQLTIARTKAEAKREQDVRRSIEVCERNIALRAAAMTPKEPS